MKVSSIDEKMSTVRNKLAPNEYTTRKVAELRLNEIIIHYKNTSLENIPKVAIDRIIKAIKPRNLSIKYSPQVFLALDVLHDEVLDLLQDEIIAWLNLVIEKSKVDKDINNAQEILKQRYWVIYTIKQTSKKVDYTLEYNNKKDALINTALDYQDTHQDDNSILVSNNNWVWITELLKLKINKDWTKNNKWYNDVINLLQDIFNENPDYFTQHFTINNKGFLISEELLEFINETIGINISDFPEIQNLSKKFWISEKNLFDVIKFNKFYNKDLKKMPITWNKKVIYSLNETALTDYMFRIWKYKI